MRCVQTPYKAYNKPIYPADVILLARRDKYESSVKLYWVDVKITGKYEEEAAESYREVVTGQEEVEDVTIGGLTTNKDDPLQLCGETEDTDEEESDDDGDGASNSRSRRDRPDKAAEEAAMEDNIHSKDPIPYSLF